jgi:DNA-3-methyladenine glycosylase
VIARSFFQRDPISCSRELIGCELVWGECAGIIVETEAYSVCNDEACHAFLRPSTRAFIAENIPGTAYVYLNYGVHWLLNVLVKGGTEDGFVLFRAIEPTEGIELMQGRRGMTKPTALCSGPGKLTQALGIRGVEHGRDLCESSEVGFRGTPGSVPAVSDVRIGITKSAELPWRFLAPGSTHVSVPLRKKLPLSPKVKVARGTR